ncbi:MULTISPECIES: hypothetical protein [unclassified Acinetobacter]|uniref:hypothetical protein n=1 Tax=unclassified Acinetobacter TaxID=196816 RepID=UPI002934C901|nr:MULTISPECIES: hypothetical protein [unclassified Acinetobacter]WOE31932.1 hypothetical protein QSG84_01520 [Acinetobacter sp. SAAs470]WOE37399.1 hypothetical protein QSG86_10565 [Acinetobacter sp. SAAs474]
MEGFLAYIQSIPEDIIAITVYCLGSFIVLWCWYGIAQCMPKFIGRMSTIIVFALLLTPTVSEGYNASIAPAIFGLLFGVLTKDSMLIWSNLAMIIFVIAILSIATYSWVKYTAKQQLNYNNNKLPPL